MEAAALRKAVRAIIKARRILPTEMGSAELRDRTAASVLAASFFSAKVANYRVLERFREICAKYAAGDISKSTARGMMARALVGVPGNGKGIHPADGARLELILNTQKGQAYSLAQLAKAAKPGEAQSRPAWSFRRKYARKVPRTNWPERWAAAARSVNWEGVSRDTSKMVALKASPIWAALGSGVGGYEDALGNAYPPFAFNSGLAWFNATRKTATDCGIDITNAKSPDFDPETIIPPDAGGGIPAEIAPVARKPRSAGVSWLGGILDRVKARNEFSGFLARMARNAKAHAERAKK